MIHVCSALHDEDGTYSKYMGTMICSLWENTEQKVTVHVLHDVSVSEEDIKRFQMLAQHYHQSIEFHCLDIADYRKYENILIHKKTTVGTLFRLRIPEILSVNIPKVIYLDADILVHVDIVTLWRVNMNGHALAACHDPEGTRGLCEIELLEREAYFNAGVLILDLERIRRTGIFWREYLNFLVEHPSCHYADQDVLNYFFRGQVLYLEKTYNYFVYLLRKYNQSKIIPAVYHYAGDNVSVLRMDMYDQLFFSYLQKTPWGTAEMIIEYYHRDSLRHVKQTRLFQKLLRKVAQHYCKKIFFGAHSKLNRTVLSFLPLNFDLDYYVDNDEQLYGSTVNGVTVFSPESLLKECRENIIIIVLSNNFYDEIRKQLEGYGLVENEDFFDGKNLLEQG